MSTRNNESEQMNTSYNTEKKSKSSNSSKKLLGSSFEDFVNVDLNEKESSFEGKFNFDTQQGSYLTELSPYENHFDFNSKNISPISSVVSSYEANNKSSKKITDSINLYRNNYKSHVQTSATQSTISCEQIKNNHTYDKSSLHTIKGKQYEKCLLKSLVESMKSFNVFNNEKQVSSIDALKKLNKEFIDILKNYNLGPDDELKCGVCCVDNLRFRESFFCRQELERSIQMSKSQSSFNLNELAMKINTFNPFERCKNFENFYKTKKSSSSKSCKSYESLDTTSEYSGSNMSLKIKNNSFKTKNTKTKFKKLESMSVLSNNLDLTMNSSSTISFMNNSQNTNEFSFGISFLFYY